ncbi:MAG: HEPN domain-containing protein [Bacillota bacterium]
MFNQHFVKTGIVPKEFGRILLNAKDIREESDYNEFYLVSKSEAADTVKQAEVFLQLTRNLIERVGVS